MLREIWPGLTLRQINEDFTPEQIAVTLDCEEDWRSKRDRAAKHAGEEKISARQFIGTGESD